MTRPPWRRTVRALGVAAVLVLGACSASGGGDADGETDTTDPVDVGDCTAVDVVVSSEKVALLTDLAGTFNDSPQAELPGGCVVVRVTTKASGAAADLLANGWRDEGADGPQPTVWSPAASAWGAILDQRLADRGQPPMAPDSTPFMLTPLVIAMPKPMADALGYPATPVGFADVLRLARDPEGWAALGHPEWGPFRLGKTNPGFSTSGLHFTVGEYYAATGKTRGLTLEDLARPDVAAFATGVESSVVHYGDITMTFLNNWFRADERGTALTYASAVAIEEKSVIDYNAGNPDGVLSPGERPRTPRVPLVAIYPKEGTLFSDNPYIVLDAPWVDDAERAGAQAFEAYLQEPANQQRVLASGFRPGNPEVAVGAPIVTANGVDPQQPQTLLDVPDPEVLTGVLDAWSQQRKAARVLLVVDVSGSMGEPATKDGFDTKLDLAKEAAIAALDDFKDDDEVGLRIFTTDLGNDGTETSLDLVPIAPIGTQREQLANRIRSLAPLNGTPLYDVAASSYATMLDGYDPARINAVVLLTDGRNEDVDPSDDRSQLSGLIDELTVGSEGGRAKPVRIFPIAYGDGADLATLRQIAEATNAAVYDSADPASIDRVFTAVVSNF